MSRPANRKTDCQTKGPDARGNGPNGSGGDAEGGGTKTPTVAIYSRVSTGPQANGYSLDEQVRLCRARCDQMGWEARYIFREVESAATTDRPRFQMMLQRAMQKDFDVLIFWKIDRVCRSLVDLVNLERSLRDHGVSLYSLTEQIDTTMAVGRFNFRNLASVAEMERELIKERVQMCIHAKALQLKWPGGRPPLGYDVDHDSRLVVNLKEADLVRELFAWYKRIRSMPQMAFELIQRGAPNKGKGRWSAAGIKKILNNRIYIGEFSVAGVQAKIKELRIVDKRTFNAVQKISHRNRPRGPMPHDRKKAAIEKVFGQYFEILKEEEEFADTFQAA